MRCWHAQLCPGGRLVLADIIPHDSGALTDALALLRLAWRNGFFVAAFAGLVRTVFSDYRKLNANEEYFAFVAGRKPLDPDPNYVPQVIACLYDSSNAGTVAHVTIASSCGYFQQTMPPPPTPLRTSFAVHAPEL